MLPLGAGLPDVAAELPDPPILVERPTPFELLGEPLRIKVLVVGLFDERAPRYVEPFALDHEQPVQIVVVPSLFPNQLITRDVQLDTPLATARG